MKKVQIQTYNGHAIDLQNPRVEDIDGVDIAHALSLINRFTGHTTVAWSVAQHSVVGSILAEVLHPEVKWLPHAFTLHDATEAYLGDVSSPLKSLLPEYRELEDKHRKTIEMAFAVSLGSQWEKTIDLRMLSTERRLFMVETTGVWSEEAPYLTLHEFQDALETNKIVTHDSSAFWDWMWSPWSAEEAETHFLERMEKLDL